MSTNENVTTIPKKGRFDDISSQQKEVILYKKNKENTNKATKVWVTCFTDYLIEKGLPDIDDIATEDLPQILETFMLLFVRNLKPRMRMTLQKKEMLTKTLKEILMLLLL